MEPIGGEVRRAASLFGPALGMAEIVAAWPEAVGQSVARNAWPARLSRDNVLHAAASSSAWAFELTQLAPQILERLREALGESAPVGLRFAVGRVPERGADAAEHTDDARPQPGPEERRLAAALTAGLADDELRELVARAAAASLARASHNRPV